MEKQLNEILKFERKWDGFEIISEIPENFFLTKNISLKSPEYFLNGVFKEYEGVKYLGVSNCQSKKMYFEENSKKYILVKSKIDLKEEYFELFKEENNKYIPVDHIKEKYLLAFFNIFN